MASNGDKQALAQFFSFGDFMDGASRAEGYYTQAWELFHVVGDKNFSNFVRDLPVTDQVGVRGTLIGGASDEEFVERGRRGLSAALFSRDDEDPLSR